jgi:ATP-dependent Clp protease protease subunit
MARIIFIDQDLENKYASEVCEKLLELNEESHEKISIYINCSGGNIVSGLFPIYNIMQKIKSPIETIGLGEIYSCAAVLLASGKKGLRYCYRNSSIMIHDVQVEEISGSAQTLKIDTKQILEDGRRMKNLLAKHTGKSLKEISKICEKDTYLTATQALKLGMVDKIL